MLIGGSIVTAIPLLLFASAVKKMTLGAIGLLNYLAPTIQFLVGLFVYKETLTPSHVALLRADLDQSGDLFDR